MVRLLLYTTAEQKDFQKIACSKQKWPTQYDSLLKGSAVCVMISMNVKLFIKVHQ